MKRSVLLVASVVVLLLQGPSVGQETQIVSPGGLQDTEGNLSSATPTVPFRVQWLYPASDFGSIPAGGAFISGHAIRADESQLTEITNTFADSVITLSTTSLNSLTANLDANLGGDALVVYDGSSSIGYPVSGPLGGPNPFGEDVPYQTPFFYDPSLGNLLVQQVSTSGNDVANSEKDWQSTVNAQFAFSLDPDSSTGQVDSRVIVTRFTIVPEPATCVLAGLACAGLLGCVRRRKRCWLRGPLYL